MVLSFTNLIALRTWWELFMCGFEEFDGAERVEGIFMYTIYWESDLKAAFPEAILIQSKSTRCSGYTLQQLLTHGKGLNLACFPSSFSASLKEKGKNKKCKRNVSFKKDKRGCFEIRICKRRYLSEVCHKK